MAFTVLILLLFTVVSIHVTAAGDCRGYGCETNIVEAHFTGVIGLVIVGIIGFFAVIICCCCCPCCCLYNMCRKPTPVIGTTTTTVVNTQCIVPQPIFQGGQYPAYHPVPTQAAYGVQPMPAGPYQAQSYAPVPPPSYQTVGPGYPICQAMSPVHPPAQEGFAPTDTTKQPAYNPAYV